MGDQCVELLERPGVEQQLEALARGQLSALMLEIDAALAAAKQRLLAQLAQPCELIGRGHGNLHGSVVGPAGIEPATSRL